MDQNPQNNSEPTPETETANSPEPQIINPTPPAAAPVEQTSPSETAPAVAPTAPAVPAEPATDNVVVASDQPSTPQPVASGGRNRKPLILAGALVGFLLLGLAGYFLLYLPNTPKNVYSRGLNRSGKALNMLVDKATAANQLKNYTASELSGDFSIDGGGQTYKGAISSKFDKQQSDSSLSYDGQGNQDLSLNVLTSFAEKATYPDVYFKLSGLQAMGLTEMLPALASYDNKWISVPSTYIQSLVKDSGSDSPTISSFTADDAASLAKIVANKTSEYLLTSDSKKAVFEQTKFLGSETVEGNVKTNHYAVELNKAHLQAFCLDISNSVISSDAYKHLLGNPSDKKISEAKASATKDCQSDRANSKGTYEIWINTKTDLLYKIRNNYSGKKGSYVELGQNYVDGSSLPIFINYHDIASKVDMKATVTTDLEKSSTTAKLTVTTEEASGVVNLSFKPYNGDIKITVPAGAIPIEQVMNALGLGNSGQLGVAPSSQQNLTQAKNKTSTSTSNLPILLQNLHF